VFGGLCGGGGRVLSDRMCWGEGERLEEDEPERQGGKK
jgi:hypothetical protein